MLKQVTRVGPPSSDLLDVVWDPPSLSPYLLTSSTRRFNPLPASVLLDATGARGPTPRGVIRS